MARAGSENFPVASRVLPRARARTPAGIYGFARLVDELGDVARPRIRLERPDAARGAGLARSGARPGAARRGARAPAARAPGADAARVLAAARAVRAADRGQPPRPARQPLRDLGAAARLLRAVRRPRRGARARRVRPAPRPRGSRCRTRSARPCSSPSTARTSPRTSPAGACTCPPRTSRRFGCGEPELAGAHASGPLRAVIAFEVRARAGCSPRARR